MAMGLNYIFISVISDKQQIWRNKTTSEIYFWKIQSEYSSWSAESKYPELQLKDIAKNILAW